MGGVDDVLIHLIGDDVGVVSGGHLRNGQQLLPGEDPAAGVGGVAQHQGLGTLAEGSLQLVHVEGEGGRVQWHIDGLRPGEDGVCPIVLIEGGEDDDLVPGVGRGHHGAHHSLGGAAGGHDFLVRVDGAAHIAGLLAGQGLSEVLGPPGDGVLMGALPGHLGQPFQDRLGRLEVGEALGQVHRAVLQGDAGHPPDHGIGETGGAFRKRLGHGQNHSLLWNSWEKVLPKRNIFISIARHGTAVTSGIRKGAIPDVKKRWEFRGDVL